MANEIVREQLGRTIKRKEALVRKLVRQETQAQKDLDAMAKHRKAVEAEVREITTHLDKLGGPIEKPEKAKGAK